MLIQLCTPRVWTCTARLSNWTLPICDMNIPSRINSSKYTDRGKLYERTKNGKCLFLSWYGLERIKQLSVKLCFRLTVPVYYTSSLTLYFPRTDLFLFNPGSDPYFSPYTHPCFV
jgi:hypothetical protein